VVTADSDFYIAIIVYDRTWLRSGSWARRWGWSRRTLIERNFNFQLTSRLLGSKPLFGAAELLGKFLRSADETRAVLRVFLFHYAWASDLSGALGKNFSSSSREISRNSPGARSPSSKPP
jgi:hypothetical protein